MKFCAACGAGLKPEARFCPACGTATAAPPPNAEAPATAATHSAFETDHEYGQPRSAPIKIIAAAIALIAVIFAGYWFMSSDEDGEPTIAVAAPPSDPDSLQAWFANYQDDFLSEEQQLFITGPARLRNFPTSEETIVLRDLNERERVSGRWVTGRDPSTRWLKLSDGGYVWEGNVGGPDIIYPSGMNGMFVGSTISELSSQYSNEGVYGEGPEYCEVYLHREGRASVMVENYRATSFVTSDPEMRTQKGARIGMTVTELQAAYEGRLEREVNPYEGVDYYHWLTPDRGIRFYVGPDGKVGTIFAGTQSIRYVEGCS